MSENTVFVKKYSGEEPGFEVNEREVWRYSGYLGLQESVDDELGKLLDSVKEELKGAFVYRVCYRRMELSWQEDRPQLTFGRDSEDLAKCLKGSSEVILFAATVGLEVDRHIAKYQRFSPTKALLMQALGAERVETLCNVFNREMKEQALQEGFSCTPRYSPGYGDLPLETQREVFRLLDCNRQIGISLNESLLMTPSKSVTAIFGLGKCVGKATEHKCENCTKTDCQFRSVNKTEE